MPASAVAAGKGEGLFANGGRIYQELRTFKTSRRKQAKRETKG
jgi:hypothetical protein